MTVNHDVGGSNPSAGAKLFAPKKYTRPLYKYKGYFFEGNKMLILTIIILSMGFSLVCYKPENNTVEEINIRIDQSALIRAQIYIEVANRNKTRSMRERTVVENKLNLLAAQLKAIQYIEW